MEQDDVSILDEHLDHIRKALTQHVQDCDESDYLIYVAAVNVYLGELLYSCQIKLETAIPLVSRTLRSAYEACDLKVSYEEDENE